jgi:deoxyribodipyrimidine photo-lyase
MIKSLIWFRQDLRISQNLALYEALKEGPVIGVYVIEQNLGGAQKWWIHHSLTALYQELQSLNIPLLITEDPIQKVIQDFSIQKVYWNRLYDPISIRRDTTLKKELKEKGVDVLSFNGHLLIEPFHITNKQNTPYKVFTPFWKHIREKIAVSPLPLSEKKQTCTLSPPLQLEQFKLLPQKPNWAKDFYLKPGENEAHKILKSFLENKIDFYEELRNIPSISGTSSLSPYLHFGEISVQTVYHAIDPFSQYAAELGWREFAHYLIYHFPHLLNQPMDEKFNHFPWLENEDQFKAWAYGETGYPIVDAGMRQLFQTGWMHNRVRMIVASFLTKHLLISWQQGASWFLDTLLDANLAINTVSWQWVAGCGPDAAPYFRIFNPIAQGEKFDPKGEYIKKWIPELQDIPEKYIHQPWTYPYKSNYPKPIIEHNFARNRALDIYKSINHHA